MHIRKQFPFKPLMTLLASLILLNFIPDSLYSQADPAPAAATTPAPSTTSTTTTTTTTLPPESSAPRSTSSRTTTSAPAATPRPSRPVPRPPYKPPKPREKTPEEEAYEITQSQLGQLQKPSLITQAVMLTLLSLLPFIIMILTSFLKIVVVLSLLRTALGVQQAPPNQIINGVGFLLSLFIMYPTAVKMYESAQTVINQAQVPESFFSPGSSTYVIEVAAAAANPMKDYLKRNSSARHQALFYRLVYRGLPEEYRATLKPDDIIVLVPSYITGQLKDAFEIGVLIYIPFFVIDLVTSNILLAMGMMMLSPVTISMPLKLFLLVMLDGWTILIEGLVKTFQ